MAQIDQLTSAIATLKANLSALQVDEPAAFSRFKQILLEANETQAILLVAGIASAPLGTLALPVTLVPGTFAPASIQADFILPPSVTFVSATLGPIPAGEGKSIQTSLVGTAVRVIVFGLNQTTISEGLDFTLNLKTTVKGSFPIFVDNQVASDASGVGLPICATSGIANVL